jgi:threonine dehydrogenase-like Zn-dependent dehydrogenase
MKAIKYLGPGHIVYADVPRPKPKPGEVLVETRAASICNQTDARVYNGIQTTYPLDSGAPGSEGSGVVAELGSGVTGFAVGDPVAMIGRRVYAEYSVRVPEELAPLKSLTSLVEAAPLGLAGCVVAALDKVGSLKDRTVAVTGLGPAGLLAVQFAQYQGAARIIGLDIRPDHLDLARALGATSAVLANDREVLKACRQTPVDVGFECSGSAQAVSLLYSMCSTVLAFGAVYDAVKIDLPPERPVTLFNGFLTEQERREGLAAAVKLYLRRKLQTRPIISQTMPFEDYPLAMQKVRRGEVLRLVLTRG